MNFNIYFNFVAAISITIDFNVSDEYYQVFFLFEDENSKVHLYRQNSTLTLYLQEQNDFQMYEYNNLTNSFSFSWFNRTVNGIEMLPLKSNYDKENWNFSFIPSVLQMNDDCIFQPLLQDLSNDTSFSYVYFILIMIVVILTIKADIKFVRHFISAIKVFLKSEDEIKSMQSIEGNSCVEHGQSQ